MALVYPDLSEPPVGWKVAQQGAALRLVPGEFAVDRSPWSIFVSPLVAKTAELPGLEQLIKMTISAEIRVRQLQVLGYQASSVTNDHGLAGVRCEVLLGNETPTEQREYVVFEDPKWVYGIHYVASPGHFSKFVEVFWRAAASVKPYPES